ncbi:hypothetical protein [Phenylobacterium sp.]|uniref:hypothetical protein n=1 Tax=Phenylobacterium sp. TaxID=1871053 RepID=UPI00286DA1E0|nr:hypothetical protein [Phenylobacterium sp.]
MLFDLIGRWRSGKLPWPSNAIPLLTRIRMAQQTPFGLELDLPVPEGSAVRWAAGASDALFGRADTSERQISARGLTSALSAHCRRPSADRFRHLYALMDRSDAFTVVDGMMDKLEGAGIGQPQVAKVARRIANEAPDVGPVKLAVALLGAAGDSRDLETLHDLGRFEELTLYVAVAFCNLLTEPDEELWRLAKATHGWGRIQTIHCLAETTDPAIKAWLLREGHHNAVMAEEIAYVCATTGGLRDALAEAELDAELLDAAGELIVALLQGGPAQDIHDYADGPEVLNKFLRHLNADPTLTVNRFNVAARIRSFVAEPLDRSVWSPQVLFDLRTGVAAYLSRTDWRDAVLQTLQSDDRITFFQAAEAGATLGVDVWPYHFARQRDHRTGDWYWLMQTDDPMQAREVVALAEAQLDLKKVASGPGLTLGLGFEFEDDGAMDFVVQDLHRFPGVGWTLIEVALSARGVRLRNMATKALHGWGRENWPAEAPRVVREALAREPDETVRSALTDLLSDRPVGR